MKPVPEIESETELNQKISESNLQPTDSLDEFLADSSGDEAGGATGSTAIQSPFPEATDDFDSDEAAINRNIHQTTTKSPVSSAAQKALQSAMLAMKDDADNNFEEKLSKRTKSESKKLKKESKKLKKEKKSKSS